MAEEKETEKKMRPYQLTPRYASLTWLCRRCGQPLAKAGALLCPACWRLVPPEVAEQYVAAVVALRRAARVAVGTAARRRAS